MTEEMSYILYALSFLILYIIYYFVFDKTEPIPKLYKGLSTEFL